MIGTRTARANEERFMEEIKKGIYEHYKGNLYQVLDTGIHTEAREAVVIYKALYKGDFKEGQLWVRPLAMFQESVTINGKEIPRFKFLRP